MTVTNPIPPKRGGVHPIFGAFIGGGPMTADYKLTNPNFRYVSQLRTVKQLQNIQNTLEQTRDSITSLKFHGNLELDETKTSLELDKKTFLEKIEQLVETYGFHSFFYMKGADSKMYSLITHSHLFTLSDVIEEHRRRTVPHTPVVDARGIETAESITDGHSKYDVYEEFDCSLSRLAVQSVIGRTLQDDIKTRYSHVSDFPFLPGSVYFLMALEASNASVALDIDDAVDKFASLSLASYPGENVKSLATEALRLIKIMEGGYCLPLRLGSDLLKKVCSTSCEHFNRWMHNKLDEVRDLELKYKLKDPKLMTSDTLYSTLGPVALCGYLQEKYGSLVTEKAWPALSSSFPASNLALTATPTKETDVRRCYFCNATDHLRDTCPKLGRDGDTRGRGRKGRRGRPGDGTDTGSGTTAGGTNGGSGSETQPHTGGRNPFPAWRYIEPVDKTSAIVVGEVTYKWCSECQCRATGKKGYFTTSHFTSEHDGRRVTFNPTPTVNHSEIAPIVPLADDGFIPEDVPDEDLLVFSGPWLCEVPDDNVMFDSSFSPAAWMTIATDEDSHMSGMSVDYATILSNHEGANLPTTQDTTTSTSSTVQSNVCVIDAEMCDLCPCDNPNCSSIGPAGFTCVKCIDGFYFTAPVSCGVCQQSIGFLGEVCMTCHSSLWGAPVQYVPLPHQTLSPFIDEDHLARIHDRNCIRSMFIYSNNVFHPPSINLASLSPTPDPTFSVSATCASGARPELEIDTCAFFDCETWEEDDYFHDMPWEEEHSQLHSEMLPPVSSVQQQLPLLVFPLFVLSAMACLLHCSHCWCLCGIQVVNTWLFWGHRVYDILMTTGCFWMFLGCMIGWDTVELLYHHGASSRVSRSVRRGYRSQPRYPRHWMILSCVMLLSGYRTLSPFSIITIPLRDTYLRCRLISRGVLLRPVVIHDLHKLRLRQLFHSSPQEESRSLINKSLGVGDRVSGLDELLGSHKVSNALLGSHKVSDELLGSHKVSDELLGSTFTIVEDDDEFHDARSECEFDLLQLDTLLSRDHLVNCIEYGPLPFRHPSKPGLNAALTGLNFLDCLAPSKLNRFPVIFDSGASVAISGNKNDFVGDLHTPFTDLRLGGMAQGAKVHGIGTVHWTFFTGQDTLTLALRCYYVPDCKARLLSPQRLFNKRKGIDGQFVVKEDNSYLEILGHPTLTLDYDSASHLPIGLATNGRTSQIDQQIIPNANLCITDDANQNLSPAQKLLMMWHFRFGHRNLPQVQSLLRLPIFHGDKYKAASRAELPKCATCQYAKAHLKSTSGNKSTPNPDTDGALKDDCLHPGTKVSVDHFESRLKGRTYASYGKTTSDQYIGGCIFVDHMSGYVHIEHQLGFSSSETIRAKQNFEQLALSHGVLVTDYLADNGIFSKTSFVDHIRQHNQMIRYCGVNAHHKNGVAERAIRTISEIARSLLLHASAHWPNGIDGTLWPMAIDYACHLYNSLPNQHGTCPADLFTGTVIPRHKLRDLHVWGCPVYVLDPTLQQGKKLPRWQPRSRRGLFLGYSPHHSSDVPLILNLQTGSISPQYHVVFDDSFSTVSSIGVDDNPPEFWTVVDLEQCIHSVPTEATDPETSLLPDDWLTPHELEEKRRQLSRRGQIRETYFPATAELMPDASSRSPSEVATGVETTATRTAVTPTVPLHDTSISRATLSESTHNSAAIMSGAPISSGTSVIQQRTPEEVAVSGGDTPGGDTPIAAAESSTEPSPLGPRRSARSTKGTFRSTKYIDEVYLSSILDVTRTHHEREMAYLAELHTDFDTGEVNHFDAHAYVAKLRKHDPDNPTYTEAMSGDDAEQYIAAMQQEILALLQQRTWTRVARSAVPPNPDGSPRKVLKGTWAFKLKRLPDGTPLKYKARYCVRGDMQTAGVDYFDTYAPVVQWSTIRLVLTLALKYGWATRQVDYTNAFAQADIQEEVYIEPPRGFVGKDGLDKVLKLCKSLYGLKQAPKTFFDKLRAGLLERGFTASNIDPCLFLKRDMICVVYVDDTILCGPNSEALEEEIRGLGVNNLETRHTFQLRNEGEVGDFLGIRIQKCGKEKFNLTQTGLIDKVLKVTGMEHSNPIATPTSSDAIGSDRDGAPFNENWKYSTVIGMLLYLSGNTRPDITFAVHQCARFSHNPKQSHAVAIKRILRYLKGTKDKGMIFEPHLDFIVNCYVDADFAGLWGVEYEQDPISVKSRTGYLITLMGCPLLWVSKMQTQIALSTMEAEYIALSAAMRELIAIREVLKEIKGIVFDSVAKPTYAMAAKTFDEIPQSTVFEDNDSCLKFASLPRMSPRTKHIAIPYHFFRTKVEALEIQCKPIDTKEQLADQFTKGLTKEDFLKGRKAVMGW